MLEPSKPIPSTQMLVVRSPISVSSDGGMEKCCQRPGRSLNLRSTICMLFFLIRSLTCFASSGVNFWLLPTDWAEWIMGFVGQSGRSRSYGQVRRSLQRLVSPFAGAHADGVRHGGNEYFAVADATRVCRIAAC